MTGFGQAKLQKRGYQITVEIRSLNSKFLEIQIKTPKLLQHKELDIKNRFSFDLIRGKVNVSIDVEQEHARKSILPVDKDEFLKVYASLEMWADELDADKSGLYAIAWQTLQSFSGQEEVAEEEVETLWKMVLDVMNEAINACQEFRQQEGSSLEKELRTYIAAISKGLDEIRTHEPDRAQTVKDRIQKHLKEINDADGFDANRFEQEMIYYLEKLDITEELVRLSNHLVYFNEVMEEDSSQGKKLGFISQEIGREINTIGSKANHAGIQKVVVEMKDELEKIKEQLLNVL